MDARCLALRAPRVRARSRRAREKTAVTSVRLLLSLAVEINNSRPPKEEREAQSHGTTLCRPSRQSSRGPRGRAGRPWTGRRTAFSKRLTRRFSGEGGVDELRGRDLGICVLDDARELVPVEPTVEPEAEPPAMADVRRDEEALPVRVDQHLLHSAGRRAPDREPAVAVVIRQHETELADACQRPTALSRASHFSAPRARTRGTPARAHSSLRAAPGAQRDPDEARSLAGPWRPPRRASSPDRRLTLRSAARRVQAARPGSERKRFLPRRASAVRPRSRARRRGRRGGVPSGRKRLRSDPGRAA